MKLAEIRSEEEVEIHSTEDPVNLDRRPRKPRRVLALPDGRFLSGAANDGVYLCLSSITQYETNTVLVRDFLIVCQSSVK